VYMGVEIPYGLSLLSFHDPNAEVKGLKEFPREHWPNVLLVHYCFQIMVGCGTILMLVSAWAAIHVARKRTLPDSTNFLKVLILISPLGFVATETGWFVTELGRQPWVVQGIMLTKDAVTPMTGLAIPFSMFTALYIFLAVIVVFLIQRQIIRSPRMKGSE